MMTRILQIINHDDLSKLLTVSPAVDANDLAKPFATIRALYESLYVVIAKDHGKPAGLSAVQIGELQRIFILHDRRNDGKSVCRAFVNPEIVPSTDARLVDDWAGCFSFDFLRVRVRRPDTVTLTADVFEVTENGIDQAGRKSQLLTGASALIAQHEHDHLDGRLTLDHADKNEIETFAARAGRTDGGFTTIFNIRDAYRAQGRHEEANRVAQPALTDDQVSSLQAFLGYPGRQPALSRPPRFEHPVM